MVSHGVFHLGAASDFSVVTILWRPGKIVFFEMCDLKGQGKKIVQSFTVFS